MTQSTSLLLDKRLVAMLRKADKRPAVAREKRIGATPERSSKPDMVPGIIARYAKRNEITKAQETAAYRLRRDYWIGEGGRVLGRQVSRYGEPRGGGGAGFHPPYTAGESRAAYDRAMQFVGRDLSPILEHVVISDQSAASWGGEGHPNAAVGSGGLPILRTALTALVRHYRLINPPVDD